MEEVAIYGFGSFFSKLPVFEDIDILIIHQSTSYDSCQFAIWCKKYLLSKISVVDITILSESEECQLSFLAKSKAKYYGKVRGFSAENNLDEIVAKLSRINSSSELIAGRSNEST